MIHCLMGLLVFKPFAKQRSERNKRNQGYLDNLFASFQRSKWFPFFNIYFDFSEAFNPVSL